MAEINIQIINEEKTHIVVINGQLDESTVDEFAEKVYALIDTIESNSKVIFDLEGLTYLNSKSLGYTTDFYNKIIAKESKLILAKPQANVKDEFNLIGLDQIIPFTQTLNEAKQM